MRLIGRYEIGERIGEGAMADVHRAYDPGIDRVLAIKLLKPEYRADADCAARFLREAKAAGALAHANIVTIYDVGEADGFPYIAMELLDGRPLDAVVQDGKPLPLETVIAIGQQLAAALAYAHGQGVVHRDVKPANIMLCADGRTVKLLDFGIARVAEARLGEEALKTQIGQVLGTPRYMSPEQALGRPVDGRSDLFSAGVVLYELLTGRPAFAGTSAATLALQITQADPRPIETFAPDCPRGLHFIVGKLIAKRPEKRFADAGQLAAALAREAAALKAVAADAGARRRRLTLPLRLTALMVAMTTAALGVSMGTVLDRQYRAMERMAVTSGASIAAFVASNAALPAVENAALPPAERDWMPVQAFVTSAASDRSVLAMSVADGDEIVRAAADPRLVGTRHAVPADERRYAGDARVDVTTTADGRGFRFRHPIRYAGHSFGAVDVVVAKAELTAAAVATRDLMLALGLVVLLVVGAASYAMADHLTRPVRRLRAALIDAEKGNLDFRVSHRRRDEFGELFDAFNRLVGTVQDRMETPRDLNATRIGIVPAAVGVAEGPADSPFASPAGRRLA